MADEAVRLRRRARKYPLVLYIHGGPHSQYSEGWFDEFQNLAGAGFMVLYTNPRGSSGYGADFTYSIRGRWGDEDYHGPDEGHGHCRRAPGRRFHAHGRDRRIVRWVHDRLDHDEESAVSRQRRWIAPT